MPCLWVRVYPETKREILSLEEQKIMSWDGDSTTFCGHQGMGLSMAARKKKKRKVRKKGMRRFAIIDQEKQHRKGRGERN